MKIRLVNYNKKTKLIGKASIEKFIEDIRKVRSDNDKEEIEVDLSDAKFDKSIIKELAEIKANYHVSYTNSGTRGEEINKYVDTYYFMKINMGTEEYIKWIVDRIRQADFPLMILDNRFLDTEMSAKMSIIQPLTIKNNELEYNRLRTYYTQPKNLEKKLSENGYSDLWIRETIKLVDLSNLDVGVRFASNLSERVILDIIKEILEKGKLER